MAPTVNAAGPVKIATKGDSVCAVIEGGTVQCWSGSNSPTTITGVSNATAVAVGSSHVCALIAGGTVLCWGDNTYGQLGNGGTTSSNTPVSVSNLNNVVAVTAGSNHTCALSSGGIVACWGGGWEGQLGNGVFGNNSNVSVAVNNLSNVVDVSAGNSHTCATTGTGLTYCWGTNGSGQLGNGSTTPSNTPVQVSNLSNATSVSAGYDHTCALSTGGTVACWGRNGDGQLGNGTTTGSNVPVSVSGLSNAAAVSAGAGGSCAITNGSVSCWGNNYSGQLGNGNTTNSSLPVTATGLTNASAISVGSRSYAMTNDHAVFRWGGGSLIPTRMPVAAFRFEQSSLTLPDISDKVEIAVVTDYNWLPGGSESASVQYTSQGANPLGAVYFPPGTLRQTIFLSTRPTGYAPYIGSYSIGSNLSNPSPNASVGSPGYINITIVPDMIAFPGVTQNIRTPPPIAVDETVANASITVTRTGLSSIGSASVQFSTADGTARAGRDYTATSGTLSWATGELGAKSFTVPVLSGSPLTGIRQFSVVLSNPTGTRVSGAATADVRIRGVRDPFIANGVFAPGWIKPLAATIGWQIATDATYGGTQSMKAQGVPNSGSGGIEYTGEFRAGTASFARKISSEPGYDYLRFYVDGVKMAEWSGEADWDVFSYPVLAGTHTFRWTYEKDASGTAGLDAAWVDAVALPFLVSDSLLGFVNPVVSLGKGDGQALLTVLRDGTVSRPATVSYTTVDGSARAGIDYTATSGTLSFAAGETIKTVSVPVVNVAGVHQERRFSVLLSAATGAVIANDIAAVSIKTDVPSVAAIDAGAGYMCGLTTGGIAVCWGSNSSGQLGNGSMSNSSVPIAVSGLSNVASISAGVFSCATTTSREAYCWGHNSSGQLGNGSTASSSVPVAVSGLSNVVNISASAASASGDHACAATSDGGAYCWGRNTYGALGNGTKIDSAVPVAVTGLSNIAAVSAGNWHSCGLTNAGTVFCWGSGDSGQLGIGGLFSTSTPVAVSGLSGITAIQAGYSHTCALASGGTVYCWGSNRSGELGNGTTTTSSVPVAVPGLSGVVAITAGSSAGSAHTCALTSGGSVFCWGNGESGQLGNGNILSSRTPVAVSGLSNAVSVSAGDSSTCALLRGGAVSCWGKYNGAVADLLPVIVPGVNLDDATPSAFSFQPQTGVGLNSGFASNQITVSGLSASVPISVSNGSYSVNGGAFITNPGSVSNGDTVSVRVNSAGTAATAVTALLTIGSLTNTFTVTTVGSSIPDPFSFTAVKNAGKSTLVTSNTVMLTGFTGALPVSVSGGTYAINGQPFTQAPGNVSSGDTVTLQQTSSSQPRTKTSTVLTVGPSSATFDVTTRSLGITPILMLLLD